MKNKKKLSLDQLESLGSDSSLSSKEINNSPKDLKYKTDIVLHKKLIKYPKKWSELLMDARVNGITSLNEASYIAEAIREKMSKDGIL